MLGALAYIGMLPRFVRYNYDPQVDQACQCVDLYGGSGPGLSFSVGGARDPNEGMTVRERSKHLSAPVGWRDKLMIGVMVRFLGVYKDRQKVDYWEAIRDLGFMDVLEGVESAMWDDGDLGMLPIQGNNKKKSTSIRKQIRNRPTQSSRRSNRSITRQ